MLGAGGAVGRVVTARLATAGHPVRAGARKPAELPPAPPGGSPVDRVPVDIDDPATLHRFCDGCAVVVNCAGPAVRIGARVAAAATATGADYVDAAGDAALAEAVGEVCGDRRAVLSAGLSPGLSELLPRYLAGCLPAPPHRLTGWHASRDRFAPPPRSTISPRPPGTSAWPVARGATARWSPPRPLRSPPPGSRSSPIR
ncbi:NAD(P)H-binding protein [Micromonospora sp. FIMYZ51]|uniref:NAD(P)H-binding protein n=1 Tax=Micromonospora sp. FIMYZ51 TaxID=3051832 RepID=UPI0031203755